MPCPPAARRPGCPASGPLEPGKKLEATPAREGDGGAHDRARQTWTDAVDACNENTEHRIRAAVELVDLRVHLGEALAQRDQLDRWPPGTRYGAGHCP